MVKNNLYDFFIILTYAVYNVELLLTQGNETAYFLIFVHVYNEQKRRKMFIFCWQDLFLPSPLLDWSLKSIRLSSSINLYNIVSSLTIWIILNPFHGLLNPFLVLPDIRIDPRILNCFCLRPIWLQNIFTWLLPHWPGPQDVSPTKTRLSPSFLRTGPPESPSQESFLGVQVQMVFS